ncbi:regulator [Nostocales cyanobacterium HT-58-2]|nr:regulator [Nostocales cyanobacterium HT-58-2]
MSDRPLKLLLVDQDPIFRLGLRVALEEFPDLQVVSEAETDTAALQTLTELAQEDPNQVNLVVLELGNGRSLSSQQLGLQLCQHLKTQYPNLPLLLLSSVQEQRLLKAARDAGVDGYCPKGTPVSTLVNAMREVITGGFYWDEIGKEDTQMRADRDALHQEKVSVSVRLPVTTSSRFPFAMRQKVRLSGIGYINTTLAEVTAQLQVPGLPLLDRAILAGQRRELLTARWLLNHLLASPLERQQEVESRLRSVSKGNNFAFTQLQPPANSLLRPSSSKSDDSPKKQNPPSLLSPRSLQATLFASCITKLQFPLQNLTDTPLEIDILRADKKRDLLYLILQKIAELLDDMRTSHVKINQINELRNTILLDVWKAGLTDFFGKFTRVKIDNNNLEIVNSLLQYSVIVKSEILNKIPFIEELFSYLLFQTDLQIDNTSYSAGSFEAKNYAEMLLENLLIQVANAVVNPLLNSLADVEEIKQIFYDRKFLSTREIERFRNNLSWRYRIRNYINEPKEVFESRYELFVFAPRGIATTSIYAPRGQELAQLSGIPLVITLALEFQDAIAPRLQSLLSFLGNSVVFVLTQVIGRGLGLIGRGILQGIGSVSLTERKNKKL